MKCIVLLSLCALSLAKPQTRQVTETEGRIIGGEEAPKRELRNRLLLLDDVFQYYQMSFPGKCLSKVSGLTFAAAPW